MKRYLDFNPLKCLRDVYSSFLSKREDYLYLNLIKKKNISTIYCGVQTAVL